MGRFIFYYAEPYARAGSRARHLGVSAPGIARRYLFIPRVRCCDCAVSRANGEKCVQHEPFDGRAEHAPPDAR